VLLRWKVKLVVYSCHAVGCADETMLAMLFQYALALGINLTLASMKGHLEPLGNQFQDSMAITTPELQSGKWPRSITNLEFSDWVVNAYCWCGIHVASEAWPTRMVSGARPTHMTSVSTVEKTDDLERFWNTKGPTSLKTFVFCFCYCCSLWQISLQLLRHCICCYKKTNIAERQN